MLARDRSLRDFQLVSDRSPRDLGGLSQMAVDSWCLCVGGIWAAWIFFNVAANRTI